MRGCVAAALVFVVVLGPGCASSESGGRSSSPTGTVLVPREGLDSKGYDVLDEVCDATVDDYLTRFETPMFRSVAVLDEVAYLVDGSHLWVVSLANPAQPVRLALMELAGHPLAVASGDESLIWVAAGEAGILGIDVSDPRAPAVRYELPTDGPALDVQWIQDRGFAALGQNGAATFRLAEQGAPGIVERIDVDGFASSVSSDGERLFVAACDQLLLYELGDADTAALLGRQTIPSGHGRSVAVAGGAVYVAAGEALYAYDASNPRAIRLAGIYEDPETPGFYVNDIVVRGEVGYIAAGDESVRAIDVGALMLPQRIAAADEVEEQPDQDVELSGPATVPIPTFTVIGGDPIAVALDGDLLLVLGNFRWVGERLLRILDVTDPTVMVDVGSYEQPSSYVGLTQDQNGLWVHQGDGTTLELDEERAVVSERQLAWPASWAVPFQDGLVYVGGIGELRCWPGRPSDLLVMGNASGEPVLVGNWLVAPVAVQNGLRAIQLSDSCYPAPDPLFSLDDGMLGYARLGVSGQRLLAYDWVLGQLHVFEQASDLATARREVFDVGACESFDLQDFYSGAAEQRSRLVPTPNGFALLCPHDEAGEATLRQFEWEDGDLVELDAVALPRRDFTSILRQGEGWLLTSFENGTYHSKVTEVSPDRAVIPGDAFGGHAVGIGVIGNSVVVLDADFGLRAYDTDSHAVSEGEPVGSTAADTIEQGGL